ncbi:MAG: YitT family protein [Bacteroidales bacterium]|nr:YitT family protein [Bacteroidales bacterium]MCF8457343.1 YitT family protein [Bacteroidales bacterium]
MAFVTKEKFLSKEWFKAYSLITLGAFILAAGFVLFINPYNIVPGGVYGIGIVVHYLTKGVFDFWPEGFPIGMFGLLMNIPLTIIGIKVLGPRFGIKTVVGFVLTSIFMDLLTHFVGEHDPLGLQEQLLLSCIFGGVLVGFGLGLIFKSKATSGGSDIVAMILAKYTALPLGQLLIYVDSLIVLIGLFVFKDWKVPLYSWIVIFLTGKVIDVTIQGISYDKALLIISDKVDLISEKIIGDLKRGGTVFTGKGMYQNVDKQMIYTVVSRRELEILKDFIRHTDPNAFMSVIDATEILGNGFKSLNG